MCIWYVRFSFQLHFHISNQSFFSSDLLQQLRIHKNRSIQHLSSSVSLLNSNVYSSTCLGEARTLQILRPFFKHNKNLRSFDLWELMTNLRGVRRCWLQGNWKKHFQNVIIPLLGICEEFECKCKWRRWRERCSQWLAIRHRNLKKLSLNLGSSEFVQGLCTALGNLLANCDSRLEYLVLGGSKITDEGATILGNALDKSW